MLRVIGLMLIVVTGAAKVAKRRKPARRSGRHGHRDGAASRPEHAAHDAGVRLQIGSGLAFAPAGQDDQRRAGLLDLARAEQQERGRDGRRLAGGRPAQGRSEAGSIPVRPASRASPTRSTTRSRWVVDYRYQSGESMNFKVAKVGGLEPNYHSHNFMIEARLEF